MVITLAAAGGESITQPEAAFLGDAVGDVGEGCRTLVGSDDEIGIITVMAHDIGGWDDIALRVEIVGDVEQCADEFLIGVDADALRFLARRIGGHKFGIETALRADRHDHRILDLLGFHQAQNFGAEIVAPVRPAKTAAGDGSETQMHAFDIGRIDEDFDMRPRQRQFFEL